MKLLLLGFITGVHILLTSTAYAQQNDLRIEFDRGTNKTIDPAVQEVESFSMITIGFEHSFNKNIYGIIGVSSGDGSVNWISKKGKKIDMGSIPSKYYSFKVGVGWRF